MLINIFILISINLFCSPVNLCTFSAHMDMPSQCYLEKEIYIYICIYIYTNTHTQISTLFHIYKSQNR